EAHVERAALREAQEESGIAEFEFVRWSGGDLVPLDLDVHTIPARGDEPQHEHWDVRFLLRMPRPQPLVLSPESHALRWVDVAELRLLTGEESVLRLAEKTAAISAARPRPPGG